MNKRNIYNKFKGHCAYCGRAMDFDDMTIDHIKPKSLGGTNDDYNTYPCCRLCNIQKADRSVEEFRRYIQDIDQQLDEDIAYRIALRYNRVIIKKPDVQFYFEKIK